MTAEKCKSGTESQTLSRRDAARGVDFRILGSGVTATTVRRVSSSASDLIVSMPTFSATSTACAQQKATTHNRGRDQREKNGHWWFCWNGAQAEALGCCWLANRVYTFRSTAPQHDLCSTQAEMLACGPSSSPPPSPPPPPPPPPPLPPFEQVAALQREQEDAGERGRQHEQSEGQEQREDLGED